MAVTQAVVLLTSALLAAGQRPSFAGFRPIGYPELVNRTTTPSGLEDKFGEGTTQRLPLEANGDRDLIDRLSKLPIDKQPFWFINWQALEANRQKPQTYPQRPNPFLEENLQNPVPINTNAGTANVNGGFVNTISGFVNTNQPQPPTNNPGFGNTKQPLPVITNFNIGNRDNGNQPSTPVVAGQTGVNIKTVNAELNNRYATETTTCVCPTVVSEPPVTNFKEPTKTIEVTNSNKPETEAVVSVKATDVTYSDVSTKQPEAAVLEPITTSNLNDRNVDTISIDRDNDAVLVNLVTDSNRRTPELTTVGSYESTDIVTEKINTVTVPEEIEKAQSYNNDNLELGKPKTNTNIVRSYETTPIVTEKVDAITVTDQSDKVESNNNDYVEPEKPKTNINVNSDVTKPVVSPVLTDLIYFPKFHSSKSLETPSEDDYEDIEVNKVIKLFPGIISVYQK